MSERNNTSSGFEPAGLNTPQLLLTVLAVIMLVVVVIQVVQSVRKVKSLQPETPVVEEEGKLKLEKGMDGKDTAKTTGPGVSDYLNELRTRKWFWWALVNGIFFGAAGFFFLSGKSRTMEEKNDGKKMSAEDVESYANQRIKLMTMVILGVIGFSSFLFLGCFDFIQHRDKLFDRSQWKESSEPWTTVAELLGGLGLMFVSLLFVRSEERSNPGMRRLLYGYNAFLGLLMVFSLIVVVNVMISVYRSKDVYQWTAQNIYKLSRSTKDLLKNLDKPLQVHIILDPRDLNTQDTRQLFQNAKRYNDLVEIFEYGGNFRENNFEKLVKKYEVIQQMDPQTGGILLVYDPDGKTPKTKLIKPTDMEENFMGRERQEATRSFRGEQVLYTSLKEFIIGTEKLKIYVTQDSGEYSIDASRVAGNVQAQLVRTMNKLKSGIESASLGYELLPWNLDSLDSSGKPKLIPDDAFAVLLVDPTKMTPQKLSVLDQYMSRPKTDKVDEGRLIALFDVHSGTDNKVLPTGVEPLLTKYGIGLGQNMVMRPANPPQILSGVMGLRSGDIDLAMKVTNIAAEIQVFKSRSINILPANPESPKGFDVKQLMITDPRMPHWADPLEPAEPVKYIQEMIKNDQKKFEAQLVREPFTLAVTARDQGAPVQDPNNPFAPPRPGASGSPRIIVFGNATILSDTIISNDATPVTLVTTFLAWMRGKMELSNDVPPVNRKGYSLRVPPETVTALYYQPFLWILAIIIAIGVGVGMMRRK